MSPTEAGEVVVKVTAPYIGDTMARSATDDLVAGGAHRQLQLLRS